MTPATGPAEAVAGTPDPEQDLLRVEGLKVHFPIRSRILRRTLGKIKAVDGIDLHVASGETLGLVGESGCGKSTTGLAVLRLIEPTAGRVILSGRELTNLSKGELRSARRDMQIVLQDPFTALDPRTTVRAIVSEPLEVHGLHPGPARRKRVDELLELVGLEPAHASRFPHEFSGGQRQRVAVARALALDPKLLILDEPMSALDVSIQAQIVNLLKRLQRELSLTYLLISHDLSVVRQVCDRIAVMYLGKVVEYGRTDEVFRCPTHPYTQALLSAIPRPDPTKRGNGKRIILQGDVPNPDKPPLGCRFHTRCWRSQPRCATDIPVLADRFDHGHPSACHYAAGPTEEAIAVERGDAVEVVEEP